MKILVIPDVHLKPWIFDRAHELLEKDIADNAVFLGDIPDDFNKQNNVQLYEETFDAAIRFSRNHPTVYWCHGNHDVCYLWDYRESGYSKFAATTVITKLKELYRTIYQSHIGYVHVIDNVLFCHGGLTDSFVKFNTSSKIYNKPQEVALRINNLEHPVRVMWQDYSPIWYRPQYFSSKLYKPRKLLQVVGHTPVPRITKDKNVLSCDTFSTHVDGRPYGNQEFCLVDTETWEFIGVK